MAHPKTNSPEERMRDRAQAIAVAVKRAREARSLSIRKLAAESHIGPSTLSRLENLESAESPKVETLDALATALNCPICELLGEPPVIEYRGLGDWPEALNTVLAERGGYITPTERAFIEERLATLMPGPEPMRVAMGMPEVQDDPDYWRSQLQLFKDSAQWRTIENLVVYGWQINSDVLRGLALIVRDATWGALPSIEVEPTETGMAKKVTKKAKPKRKAGTSKAAARKKTRRKKARS